MVSPVVIFDCDDVMANIRAPLHQAMANRGYFKPVESWHTFDFQDTFGISAEACLEIMVKDRILERAEPERGARDAVRLLQAHGYRVEIWTARGWHPGPSTLTAEWCERHLIPVDNVRVFGLLESKAQAMHENFPVAAFLDDNLRHIEEASSNPHVRRASLMTSPWNLSSAYVDRTDDLLRFATSLTDPHRFMPRTSIRPRAN